MTTNSESEYGMVKRMREIRDELNEKLMNMTFEEEKAYYREQTTQWLPHFYDEIDKSTKKLSH